MIRNHQKSTEHHQIRKSSDKSSEKSSEDQPTVLPLFGWLNILLPPFQLSEKPPFLGDGIRSSLVGSLRFSDLDLDALEVGGDLQWQEPSDNSNSADITEGEGVDFQVGGRCWGGMIGRVGVDFLQAKLKLNVHLHLATVKGFPSKGRLFLGGKTWQPGGMNGTLRF